MKRLLIILSVIAMCFTCDAQTVDRSMSASEDGIDDDLKFEGSVIGGDYADFERKITSKDQFTKLDVKLASGRHSIRATYAGKEDCRLIINEKPKNNVNGVALYHFPEYEYKAIEDFHEVKGFLKSKYLNTTEVSRIFYDEKDRKNEMALLTVYDSARTKVLGFIYLFQQYGADNEPLVVIRFKNVNNTPGQYSGQCIDVSNMVNGITKCIINVYDMFLIIEYVLNNKKFSFFVFDTDKTRILNMLFDKQLLDFTKKQILSRFIQKAANWYSQHQYDYCMFYAYKGIYNDYLSYIKTPDGGSQMRRETLIGVVKNMVFTKSEQRIFDKYLPQEMQNKLIGAGIGIATGGGGNGQFTCGTCGRKFSNQADLRSHQNADHDY